mmetsp:Transcript_63602/g.168481  ORF Transcript_63602/g.168481 Transcript_63602/m.168481 type:complete len:206 (-) Transcript_63602:1417-2034(-)
MESALTVCPVSESVLMTLASCSASFTVTRCSPNRGSILGSLSRRSQMRPTGSSTEARSRILSKTPRSFPPIMQLSIIMMATSSPALMSPLYTFSAPMESVSASPRRCRRRMPWPEKPARVRQVSSIAACVQVVCENLSASSSSIANSLTVLISLRTCPVLAAASSPRRRVILCDFPETCMTMYWPTEMNGSGRTPARNMSTGAME